jgi:hypothetical protein
MQGIGQTIQGNWGTAHPCYNQTNTRLVKWSNEEIAYISIWYNLNLKKCPNIFNSTVKCLTYIKNDPYAMPIFHYKHIKNSGRLRVGYNHCKLIEEEKKLGDKEQITEGLEEEEEEEEEAEE